MARVLDPGGETVLPGHGDERAVGQLRRMTSILRHHLGDALVGVYLHGSLAMGCFNPRRSDLDALAVTSTVPTGASRRDLLGAIMRCSLDPFPLEISVLHDAELTPWRYPTPYLLHYSESWRARVMDMLAAAGSAVQDAPLLGGTDPDLAAHITILNARGVRLEGPPIAELFPAVPAEDSMHSLLLDLDWAIDRVHESPVYLVLNACRVLAFLREGKALSKLEGGAWAVRSLPRAFAPLLEAAVESYRGAEDIALDETLLDSFVADVKRMCAS